MAIPHRSWFATLSVAIDCLATWTQELKRFCENHCIFWAIKHESGENGKLHIHFIMIFEIVSNGTKSGGAKTKARLTDSIKNASPNLREYLIEHPSNHSLVLLPLLADKVIMEYMQKESTLKYFELPKDTIELQPYFAELQKAKVSNPEFDAYASDYKDRDLEMPCTIESSWDYFATRTTVENNLKAKLDPRQKIWRANHFVHHINGTKEPMPVSLKRKSDDHPGYAATCNGTHTKSSGEIIPCWNLKPYRKQYCDKCVGYDRAPCEVRPH